MAPLAISRTTIPTQRQLTPATSNSSQPKRPIRHDYDPSTLSQLLDSTILDNSGSNDPLHLYFQALETVDQPRPPVLLDEHTILATIPKDSLSKYIPFKGSQSRGGRLYDPLPAGWFRVLIINPSKNPSDSIQCQLLLCPFEKAPTYVALSYT
jgi:hypothetical protein